MRTVLIVGAGATLSQAQSYRPVQAREHPPLDGNFFDRVDELGETHNKIEEQANKLSRTTARVDGFFDPFEEPAVSLEQYFADVYYEVAGSESDGSRKVYIELLRLYNRVLGTTTNWMRERDRLGSVDRLLRQLKPNDGDELTVITFNQDLLLENRALHFPRWHNDWCLNSLYSTSNLSTDSASSSAPFPPHGEECRHDPPFQLLKLHGSLNWVLRSEKRSPNRTVLFPEDDKRVWLLNTDQALVGARTRREKSTGRWHLWPMVVPPIYEKQKLIGTNIISGLWDKARQRISNATKVVLFGYSIPEADVTAAQMLRRSIVSNQRIDAVDCINPDPGLAGKLKRRLGVRVIRLFHDAQSYLEHRPVPN